MRAAEEDSLKITPDVVAMAVKILSKQRVKPNFGNAG